MSDSQIVDVAIVGMGPAGLYSAWRLSTSDPELTILNKRAADLTVALFDTMSAGRVGGRLCTQPMPGYPFLAELGGMRFRGGQRLVRGLVDALGLESSVRPFSFDQHFYYLRGRRKTSEQLQNGNGSRNPYRLVAEEQGRLPHALIEIAILNTLKSIEFDRYYFGSYEANSWGINHEELKKKMATLEGIRLLTPREWAIIKRFGLFRGQQFFWETGFWDLLQFHLSSEGWHYAHDGLGYESIMGNWNSSIALPWFLSDFASDEAFTLEDGMKSIPTQLHKAVLADSRFQCHYDWDLAGLDIATRNAEGEPLVRLQFNTPDQPHPVPVLARSVILALPKGALIRLDYGESLISTTLAPARLDRRSWFFDLLNSVDGKPLFKLFLAYDHPWWTSRHHPAITGKVNTDLPLRQSYYYGKDQWNRQRAADLGLSDTKDRHSMVMASYSDSHYIEFWTELNRSPGRAYVGLKGGREALSSEDRDTLDKFGASRSMILRAEHQLGLLHGMEVLKGQSTPRAELGLYMEWSRPPYYAGWHSWKVDVQPWAISGAIMNPFHGANVYICGEAYSDEQGWTEGALKSAERVMTQVLQIPLHPSMLSSRFAGNPNDLREYLDILDRGPGGRQDGPSWGDSGGPYA